MEFGTEAVSSVQEVVGHGNVKPNLGPEMKPVITAMKVARSCGATLASNRLLCHVAQMKFSREILICRTGAGTAKLSAVVPTL